MSILSMAHKPKINKLNIKMLPTAALQLYELNRFLAGTEQEIVGDCYSIAKAGLLLLLSRTGLDSV